MGKKFEFQNRIKTFCRQNELLADGDRVLLGLSGGADSVCLFLLLEELAKSFSLTLFPVHINHNLRGEEADRDQQFCEELCREHNCKLTVISVDVETLAGENGWTLEEAGRNARYQAFSELKENFNCDKIAVAHHKNDQAETVLFQLLRGSRLKGLSGMEAVNGSIIRPLLCVTREEIEIYLQENKQNFCIDRTNLEDDYSRNRIRHRLLPAAEQLQPRAVEHVAETAEYLNRVEKLLRGLTEDLYRQCVTEDGLGHFFVQIEPLKNADGILAERVLYEVLCRAYGCKKDITAGFVTDCMELMQKQTGRYVTLPEGLMVQRRYAELWIGRERRQTETYYAEIKEFPFRTKLPGNMGTLHLSLSNSVENEENIPKSTYTKWFDYDKIEKIVSLRTPEPEDMIVLYTDGRKKRIMDILKEAKVPKEERGSIRILAEGNRVLWIPGIRGSEAYRVTKSTKRILKATIDGGNEDGRQNQCIDS